MQTLKIIFRPGLALILSALLAGCQSIGYYSQALSGQSSLWWQQRDIEVVLSDPSVDSQTRSRLQTARQAREFASVSLKLPLNKSYSRYVDLGREYVIWNVVATPRYSVEAVQSCFPVVGCVSYRGYYRKQAALDYAEQQEQAGLDVYVGGVSAYSTLGWFDDPLLSSMLTRSDAAIAGLVFHELAHQRVYIKDDTRFNESFATVVERLGLQQWGASRGESHALRNYLVDRSKRDEVVRLLLEFREKARRVYLDNASAGETRLAEAKREQFEALQARYLELKLNGGGTPGFDRFFTAKLNNASLAIFGEYHAWVAAFERVYENSNQDWNVFYSAVEALSRKPKVERDQALQLLTASGTE